MQHMRGGHKCAVHGAHAGLSLPLSSACLSPTCLPHPCAARPPAQRILSLVTQHEDSRVQHDALLLELSSRLFELERRQSRVGGLLGWAPRVGLWDQRGCGWARWAAPWGREGGGLWKAARGVTSGSKPPGGSASHDMGQRVPALAQAAMGGLAGGCGWVGATQWGTFGAARGATGRPGRAGD
jgi:hypothetical protein